MSKSHKKSRSKSTKGRDLADLPALRFARSYVELREVDRFMSERELVRRLAIFEWTSAFKRLAFYASFLTNNRNSLARLRSHLQDALSRSTVAEHRRAASHLRDSIDPNRPLAHPAAINLLQANVILFSKTEGHTATDADLAYLLLAANTFEGLWKNTEDDDGCSRKERVMANTARSLVYSRGGDALHTLLRVEEIFGTVPERTPEWNTPEAWLAAQQRALGCCLSDYIETLAGPFVIQTANWGVEDDSGTETRLPQLRPDRWFAETDVPNEIGRKFISSLAVDRDEARRELEKQRGTRTLLLSPTLFIRRPLVWVNETDVVAASPAFLEDQIRMGIWAKFLNLAKSNYSSAEKWTSAFGDMFERRCVKFVDRVLAERPTGGIRRVPSEAWGEEEDIVLTEGNAVFVISVKASSMPEDRLKGSRSVRSAVDWYERFYFGERSRNRRAGALILLEKKIQAIQKQEKGFPPRPKFYPIVLTYDRLSADNPGVYRWVAARCNRDGILNKCKPLTLLDIDGFELLMAIIATGASLRSILEEKTTERWRDGQLSLLLHEKYPSSAKRLPWAEAAFEELSARIRKQLFSVEM